MITDSYQRYGTLSRFFHWTVALLVLHQFLKFSARLGEAAAWLTSLVKPWHVSVGLLILGLTLARTLWAMSQQAYRPRYPSKMQWAVKIGHILLYLNCLLLPLSGILFMLSKGYGLSFFSFELIAKSKQGVSILSGLGQLHAPLAWGFLTLVLGHINMALYHRDGTLKRML